MRRLARLSLLSAATTLATTLAFALPLLAAPEAALANAPRRGLGWQETSALIKDKAVAALVDKLAQQKRVDDPKIYYAGSPSPIYKVYQRLAARATAAQMLRLLRHKSPIVRLYAGEHVVKRLPRRAATVYALLSDRTTVQTQRGCLRITTSVGESVLRALIGYGNKRPAAQAVIKRAAADAKLPKAVRRAAKAHAKRRP
jgi:hypothetical protein